MTKTQLTTTVTFADLSTVYEHLGLTSDEVEWFDQWQDDISHGDAFATLVGCRHALDRMVEAYESYHTKSMTRESFSAKFWELADTNDFQYINLEF